MPDDSRRPNILFLMDDQHRYDYLGCMGADFVSTPSIDSIAERGMCFTHCCTNSPVCAPARISLATGLLPTRTGTLSNDTFLPLSARNHYRHFRNNGYRVELVGRHDLAKTGAPGSIHGNRPLNYAYGFTRALEVEGGMSSARAGETGGRPTGPYTRYLADNGLFDTYVEDFSRRRRSGWIIGVSHQSALPKEHHQDSFVGRKAVERLEQMEDDYPWYMFVSFQSPHDPFDPPAELCEQYRNRDMPPPIPTVLEGKPRRIRRRYQTLFAHATAEDVLLARRQYCAKVALIDEQVGLILDTLDRRGLRDNTIVVFASDHGEMLGDHGLFQKCTAYESSMRVPLLVSGPGVGRRTCDALVELSDVNPTLVELAGLTPQQDIDARSFTGVLGGTADEHRDSCVTCEREYSAIRTQRHKYVETHNDSCELYDLQEDPSETRNLFYEDRDTVNELSSVMKQRFTEGKWLR